MNIAKLVHKLIKVKLLKKYNKCITENMLIGFLLICASLKVEPGVFPELQLLSRLQKGYGSFREHNLYHIVLPGLPL